MIKKIFIALLIITPMMSCSQKISQTKVLADLKELSDDKYEGRKTDTKGGEKAANFVANRFKELGIATYYPNFKQPFIFTNKKGEKINGNNVVGYIQGKTNEVIVISGHYDHLGIINGKIFNGADDDASGTCAVLAYAEYFSKNKPQHTLIFCAFDAEEMGLQGSKYFVANPPVDLKNIKININMDMIAHNEVNELYASGTFLFPELKKFIFTKTNEPKILFGHDDPKLGNDDWTYQSDHGSFYAKKIPFIYFGVEDHKDYHKETDEFQNINQAFYINSVQSILEIIKNFDKNYSLKTVQRETQIMN